MKKTKVMIVGFAVFAAMLMLMTTCPTNVEARENPDNTSTSTTNGIITENILEAAREDGCVWATTHSMEVDMQSNPVQMNNEYTSPFTEVASGLVQESSLSQSACSLCASK